LRKGVVPALAGALATFVGLVFVTVGTWSLVSASSFFAGAERADGLVVDVRMVNDADGGRTWYPVVLFRTAGGQRVQFESSSGGGPDSYERGDRVPVAYDPDTPRDARLATFTGRYAFPGVFLLLGGVATLVGGTVLTIGVRASMTRGWLVRNGQRVQGQVVYAGPDLSTTINGKHPYVVRASFQDPRTGRTYQASSDRVWADPRPALEHAAPVVLFDPRKPNRSLVELRAAATGNDPSAATRSG
jgi:Protein of unknown function (DUF3592)